MDYFKKEEQETHTPAKRALGVWSGYLTLLAFVIMLLIAFSSNSKDSSGKTAEELHQEAGEIQIGSSSESLKGENYKDVIKKLEKAGFTNVEEEAVNDVVLGIMTKEGEVERVSIDGDTTFYTYDWVPADASVVVVYHTSVTNSGTNTQNTAETEPVDTRTERDAFYDNTTYKITVGGYEYTIPDYWIQDKNTTEFFRAYAETKDKSAMLDIRSEYDDEDPVGFEWLDEQYERDLTLQSWFVGMTIGGATDCKVISEEIFETDDIKGVLWAYSLKQREYTGTGKMLIFPSKENNSWVYVSLMVTDNTLYKYDNDFEKIISSIKKTDNTNSLNETTAAEKDMGTMAVTETASTAETTPSVEAETVKEAAESEPEQMKMPILAGTSIDTVTKKASEYGLSKQPWEDDFGHGTKLYSFANKDQSLMLDALFSTDTSELLCATIVTLNTTSSQEQQKFIKGMSNVLCPAEDVKDVTEWVNANVGKAAKTNINGTIYELSLGPVNNALYYAGEKNWEEWDSQF